MYKLFLFICFLFLYQSGFSQNTVGLIKIDNERLHPGYNLIFPHSQSNVYLLDNCGEVVHTWEDDSDMLIQPLMIGYGEEVVAKP